MVNQKKFLMNEMPWGEFKQLGLSEEQFLDLPKESIDRIMTGRLSPLMKMRFVDEEGNTMKVPESLKLSQNEDGSLSVKFKLVRDDDGNVHVQLQPKRLDVKMQIGETTITPEQLERMKNQESVRTMIRKDGKDEMYYVQLDKDLNILQMGKEKNVVIPNAIGDVVIGNEIEQRLREGKPVELEVGDTKVTIGVDLNDKNGFRVVEGDMDEWKQRKLEQWDRVTPGVKGYWKTTENGWAYELHHERERTVGQESEKVLKTGLEEQLGMTQSRGMRR